MSKEVDSMSLKKAQKELRLTGVTASEIAAVCGFSPWRGPHSVWLEKIGRGEQISDNPNMARGRLLEGPILSWLSKEKGIYLAKVGRSQETIKSKKNPIIIATPDAIVSKSKGSRPFAVAEAKSPGVNTWDHWILGGKAYPPKYVIAQNIWQMAALNFKKGYIAALVKSDLVSWEIDFDSDYFGEMLKTAKNFWKLVERGTPPPPDFGNPYLVRDFVSKYYEQKKDKIAFDLKLDEVAKDLIRIKEDISSLEDNKTKLENIIKSSIGKNAGVRGSGWVATWRETEPVYRWNFKKLNEAGKRVEKYREVVPGERRFIIKREY
jgi:putative phage-type endonuclease